MHSDWAMAVATINREGMDTNDQQPQKKRARTQKKPAGMLVTPLPRLLKDAAGGRIEATPWPRTPTIGSICAGMLTDHHAIPFLDHNAKIAWWCENAKIARRYIEGIAPGLNNYDDVLMPEFFLGAPPVDILTAGFPCQPFSSMGLNEGQNDPRGVVIYAIILFMRRALPRVAILENVEGLVNKHTLFLVSIIELIRQIKDPSTGERAYATCFKTLTSCKHGWGPPGQGEDLHRLHSQVWQGPGAEVPVAIRDRLPRPTHAFRPQQSQAEILCQISLPGRRRQDRANQCREGA